MPYGEKKWHLLGQRSFPSLLWTLPLLGSRHFPCSLCYVAIDSALQLGGLIEPQFLYSWNGSKSLSQDYFKEQIQHSRRRYAAECVTRSKSSANVSSILVLIMFQLESLRNHGFLGVSAPAPATEACPVVPACSADVLGQTATVNCNYLQPTVEPFLFPLLCLAAGGSHYHAGWWW